MSNKFNPFNLPSSKLSSDEKSVTVTVSGQTTIPLSKINIVEGPPDYGALHPTKGQVIYNPTDEALYFANGARWDKILTESNLFFDGDVTSPVTNTQVHDLNGQTLSPGTVQGQILEYNQGGNNWETNSNTAPSEGDVLIFSSGKWTLLSNPTTLSVGNVTMTYPKAELVPFNYYDSERFMTVEGPEGPKAWVFKTKYPYIPIPMGGDSEYGTAIQFDAHWLSMGAKAIVDIRAYTKIEFGIGEIPPVPPLIVTWGVKTTLQYYNIPVYPPGSIPGEYLPLIPPQETPVLYPSELNVSISGQGLIFDWEISPLVTQDPVFPEERMWIETEGVTNFGVWSPYTINIDFSYAA